MKKITSSNYKQMKLHFSILNYCPYTNSSICGAFWFFQTTNQRQH